MNIILFIVKTVLLWLIWNWLMPVVFGLPEISFLQSLGLHMLCNIMFKTIKATN